MQRTLLAFGLSLLVPASVARADVIAHPTLAAGFAYTAVGYEGYAFAPDLRAGVDLELDGERSHLLALDLAWTGWAISGARLDVLPVSAGWRWVPAPEIGFYTIVALGVGVAIDTFDAQLGARAFSSIHSRAVLQASIGIGITIAEHLDVEIVYRQAALAGDLTDALGTIGARVGGRL